MKFVEFKIKNFRGIEDLTINFDRSPNANVYTLVGLNESGKTTILDAINVFRTPDPDIHGRMPTDIEHDYNTFIPISRRDNFTDTISLQVTLELEEEDLEAVNKFATENTPFESVVSRNGNKAIYYRDYHYNNSEFVEKERKWSAFKGIPKETDNPFEYVNIDDDDNIKLANFCKKLIPSILYFPNFLFDFPSRIYLRSESSDSSGLFYIALVQDILFSLNNDTNVEDHLINRVLGSDENQKRNLERLLQMMERKVTDVVFGAWNKVFKRHIKDTSVRIKCLIDEKGEPYLDFQIESEDGIYQLGERSLGFKWFFIFLLFTQFRPFRKNSPKNVIFLFDEPASNLHSSAQKQLLKSFDALTENCKIIYTTHSHHLINPNWLESTFVVKNEGFHLEQPEVFHIKKTNITIEPYRDFATKHPHNTAYFQPILDVLEYVPSSLENIPDCIFMEGKNDFYTATYFNELILKKRELNFMPSTGSGNLDTLISLYIGWSRNFIILLDSDKAGLAEKKRYLDVYGPILDNRIFLLGDIIADPGIKAFESFFDKDEALEFQKIYYPDAESINKTHFNRSLQEALMNRNYFEFSSLTTERFDRVLEFLHERLADAI